MKKYIFAILTICTAETQLHSHSGGAVAGGVFGGVAAGYILARLIHKGDNNPTEKTFQQEAKSQKKIHQNKLRKHKKELKRLKKDKKEHTSAAQHHREQIQHHESLIARIEQELRDFLGHDKKRSSKNR